MSFRFPDRGAYLLLALLLPPSPLRVCSDPDNLPFSNRHGDGFENRIAELIARDLHTSVAYTWAPQRRGFVAKSIKTGACDVIVGIPGAMNQLLRTAPYYRSTYVVVTRRAAGPPVRSLDDPRLRRLRIGVQVISDDGADTPPALALARRGIIRNVRNYVVPDDRTGTGMPSIMSAVTRGSIDIAIAWGPLAGYWSQRSPVPLAVSPLASPADMQFLPFAFDITIGVRQGDSLLRMRIDSVLSRRQEEIGAILDSFHIPRVPGAALASAP